MKKSVRLLLLPLAAGLIFLGTAGSAALSGEKQELMEISVEENETLWDIAVRHSNDSVDVRTYLYDIRQINGITSSAHLQPGQRLLIPVLKKNG